MANGLLPSHIIELDDSVDNSENDFDADHVALRIAASRAQNAALQYEARTASMKTNFSASSSEKRDQSPSIDARSPTQHHEQGQERCQERERSSCDKDRTTPNPRAESLDLGFPDTHSAANRSVQPRNRGSAEMSPTRTKPRIPSCETGEDRLSAVNVIALGQLYHTDAALSEPRPQAVASTESTTAQKRRNRTSSPDVWMKKISRKKARKGGEVTPATRTARLGRQSSPGHAEESDSRDENMLLTTVFRTEFYPVIKAACSQHPSIRSQEQAHTVGRAVSTEVVNDELRSQLRDSGYTLSDAARKRLRRVISNSVDRMTAPLMGKTTNSESSPAESSFGTGRSQSHGVGNSGPGEPPIGHRASPELSHGTSGVSADLSLLGPGVISSGIPNFSISAVPTEKIQGQPSTSNVVQMPDLGTLFHGKVPESVSPPKLKRLGATPPPAVSIHGRSRSSKSKTATNLDINRSPDAPAVERDNQKLWHCVCGKKYKSAGGLKSHRAHSVPCNNGLNLKEATTLNGHQVQRVPLVEKCVSLLPSSDELLSSGINTSARPGRVDNSECDIRTFSFNTALMANNLRDDILLDSGPLQSPGAGLSRHVGFRSNASESTASPSVLPPVGLFRLSRSSSAFGSSARKALATSVNDLNHSSLEKKQIAPAELSITSSKVRETQKSITSEVTGAVGGDPNDKRAGTLPGQLCTDSVAGSFEPLSTLTTPTQLSSAGDETCKRDNTEGEIFQGYTSAREREDTPTIPSYARAHTLPSQLSISPFESVTVSNNGISTLTEVLAHHPKAPARTLLEDKTNQSSQRSQFAMLSRESQKRCKPRVTTDQVAPSLRPQGPRQYYPDLDCESQSTETFESVPPTPAGGLTTTERHQSVQKWADPEHVTQPQTGFSHSMFKLGTSDQGITKEFPYLSLRKRKDDGIWAGRIFNLDMIEGDHKRIIHWDFEDSEYEELIQAAYKTLKSVRPQNIQLSAPLRLAEVLKNTSKEDQVSIRKRAHQKGSVLERRKKKDIKSLIRDASHGALPEHPITLRIKAFPQPIRRTTPSLLRNRQIGLVIGRGFNLSGKALNRELRTRISEGLATWKSWSDASNDVLVVAWSPNGSTYAVGASAQTDPASAQYNKRNNLLLGDLESNTLRELPDHHIDRPIPEDLSGTQWALYNTCDPLLQTSVTATRFSVDGDRMYTASYDHTVKVWDVSQRGKPFVVDTLKHDAEVELAAISSFHSGVLATGSRTREDSIRVYYASDSDDVHGDAYKRETFSSSRAKKHSSEELYPSSLQWGTTAETSGLLLAGFSPKVKDDTEGWGQNGEVCLWDLGAGEAVKLSPSSQNVFDAVWHPNLPIFATGSTPQLSNRATPKTRSVVRTYEPLRSSLSTVEYECPALDINDVTFAPYNVNYISAGCTDGITYVWDYRMPDTVMLQLQHSEPLAEAHPYLTREQHDTGVRFTAWDGDGHYFYTGASDGVIKQWDIRRAAEDTLVRDVAQLKGGVMCGSFSPDYSNLLVGDDTGAIHILSTAPTRSSQYTEDSDQEGNLITEGIPFIHAPQNQRSTTVPNVSEIDEEDSTCYGTIIADDALASGKLSLHPIFGAGKGPNYSGSYCLEARAEGTTDNDARTVPLLPKERAQQLDRRQRKKARKQGWKAKKAEQEIIKEQVNLAWMRNVNVELLNHWGDEYVKERDETLVKQFKQGKNVVQILKELRLQHSGGRGADITDLEEGSTRKHYKDDKESDEDVVMRKKSKHRHLKVESDDKNLMSHSTNRTKASQYRQVGNLVILDSDNESDKDEASTITNLEKHYDVRDAWLVQEHNHVLFEDAEESWFISREAEREQVQSEVIVEEAKRRKEQERKREQDARATEEKRRRDEARAKLLAGG